MPNFNNKIYSALQISIIKLTVLSFLKISYHQKKLKKNLKKNNYSVIFFRWSG